MSIPPIERRKRRRRADGVAPAIHWYEGMLLAPQHFQLASRRAEELLHYHATSISPFHWGVIDIARTQLTEGVMSVTRIEAVMPDGLVVAYPGRGSQGDLSIDVNSQMKTMQQDQQTVFLTAAARTPGDSFTKRYGIDTDHVRDETIAEDELAVKVLHPRLQLVLGDYLPDSSVGFPIARVEKRGSAVVELEYEPPRLQVRSGTPLHDLCGDLASTLRAKANGLAASIEHSSASTQEAALLETRILIHSLASALPPLEALLDTDVAHPFALYMALASAAGNLASRSVPNRLPAYAHENLLEVFNGVLQTIDATIRDTIHAPYELHPFVLKDDAFRLQIEFPWVRHKLMLGVRAPAGVNAKDVDRWVVESAIGEAGAIPDLVHDRSRGLKRERVSDAALPASSGVTFYELPKLPSDFLVTSKELVIRNVNDGRPAEIVLYVNMET